MTRCEECGKEATHHDEAGSLCNDCYERWFAEEFAYWSRHATDPRLDSDDTQTRLKAYMELKEPWVKL